ncbi:dynein light chain Tctex-type protein 2B-like [Onthophagus taurus]|uniref:dynein light chain Tctex-type protein 2B-like n=1 Tax=Onthophagus taurus TaxID=166361 RepID=UPI000C20C3AA|nr:tctex1 domain-containing protein 2-like [Onthophagus taurus]
MGDQDSDTSIQESRGKTESVAEEKPKSYDSVDALSVYQLRPAFTDKFKGNQIKEIILSVLTETLLGKVYSPNNAKNWTIKMANSINEKVKELQMKRYKHIVQVTIGEIKGAGVKAGVRCLWDAETDSYTSEQFINETIFSVVVVFGIYLY